MTAMIGPVKRPVKASGLPRQFALPSVSSPVKILSLPLQPLDRPAPCRGAGFAHPTLSGGMSEAIPPDRPGWLRPKGWPYGQGRETETQEMTNNQTAIEAFIVPLHKLQLDPNNVRKTHSKQGIEELAATIRADDYRLLQNLVVRKAEKKGHFLVTAGGRRLAALQLLQANGEIDKDYGVECKERGADEAIEISLVENVLREDMHPVDQFEAYSAMAEAGRPIADIAARFGKTERFVQGRLALARVSPELLQLYRDEDMTFEQLQAFTICDDHERQMAVWQRLGYYKSASSIRAALQTDSLTANDKRLKFIGGIEAYEEAGGAVRRDLFDDAHSGYATDISLVEKLVQVKFESVAAELRAEGWQWIDCCEEFPHQVRGMDRVYPHTIPLTEEQEAEREAHANEYDELLAKTEAGEATDAEIERLDAIEKRQEELNDQSEAYAPSDIAKAGCVIYLDYYGELVIARGIVRPVEDETEQADDEAVSVAPVQSPAPKKSPNTLPAAFVQELSAQKTAAIRAELAHNPDVALAAVVYSYLLPLFLWGNSEETCLELRITSEPLQNSIKDAGEVKAIQALDGLFESYSDTLPGNPDDLWEWCISRDRGELLNALAFAAAKSVDAIQLGHYSRSKQRAHADKLAEALGMNMREWFAPTAANYFSRISKAGIEAALAEAKGADFAAGVSGMKKADAAAYAERQVAGTDWLPEQVRLASDSLPEPEVDLDDEPEDADEHDYNNDLDTGLPEAAE